MNNITIPWPDWKIVRRIGRGGFGTVYEISRTDQFGYEEKAALKVIRIPNEAGVIDQFRMDGYDNASISARLKEVARKINQEYYLQNQLKGNPNVVRVDENMVTAHEDGLGWDIFIRMELLRPMMEVLMKKQDFSEKEIIKIGKDICEALNVCHARNIIHRDIKPDNIFRSDSGDWKLGDFGIARTMEHTTTATKAGTPDYEAPEVYHGERYGKEVDIYSLGLVLYWLLNKRRRPFLPVDRPPTASEDEQARIKRLRGDPLPAPVCGSEGLKRIVLKACAYHPKDRYASPEEMLMELQAVESGAYQGNASAAAGKDTYDSFAVLESAYEGSGISAGYGNGSDVSIGSRSAAGEGVSMGNGWEKDDPGSIGSPHWLVGGRNKNDFLGNIDKTQPSVEIDNVEKEPEKKASSSSNTVEGGKKAGIIIPIIVAAIVAAFFIFGGKSDSSETAIDTAFLENTYHKYWNELFNSMNRLKVDYENDSMETIAKQLQASGWSFLPYGENNREKMTPAIPDLGGQNGYTSYLHAVYPLPDAEWCQIEIATYDTGTRDICFYGGADVENFPSVKNESGTWERDLSYFQKAMETQRKAFSGFLPSSLIELLDKARWEDLGFTNEQIERIRSLNDGKSSGSLSWGDDFGGWYGFYNSEMSKLVLRNNKNEIEFYTCLHDSNLISYLGFKISGY